MSRADELIVTLGLLPHPEGGNYRQLHRQIYVNVEGIPAASLPGRFAGDRPEATSIY